MAPKCFTMPTSPTPTCVYEPSTARMKTRSTTIPTALRPIAGPAPRAASLADIVDPPSRDEPAQCSKASGCEAGIKIGSGPLAGIQLLTMALRVPGPVAAQRLRLLGARIVKIEPPAGDHLATQAPEWYRGLHESQEIVHLDLRNDADIAKLHGLLEESDLLLTSQRARVLERLGLAWPALHMRHPRICAVEITGHPAPRQNVPGHDITYLAEANLLDPPRMPRTLLAVLAGAERAVQAALPLIVERQRLGRVGPR